MKPILNLNLIVLCAVVVHQALADKPLKNIAKMLQNEENIVGDFARLYN